MDIRRPERSFRYNYTGVIRQLRYWGRSETEYYGIPVIKPPANPTEITVVRVLAEQDDIEYILDVAINMSSLYIVGYVRWDDHSSAYFLKDNVQAMEELFAGTDEKYLLAFSSDYSSLEYNANLQRENMITHMTYLSLYIVNLYLENPGDESYTRTQARLVLYLTQVLSEATRFRYIKKLFSNDVLSWIPNWKIVSLENNWQTISNKVKNSVSKTLS